MVDELIKALRCSSSTKKLYDCNTCPYSQLEEVDERIPILHDLEKNGVKYWVSCDCERICRESADVLEKVKEVME